MLWPLPELDMTGLTTHGSPTAIRRRDGFLAALGEDVARGFEPQVPRRKIADPVAVHGQLDCPGRRRDAPSVAFQFA